MTCICAPLMERNIEKAQGIGVAILGCCGDQFHTSGFHVPAALLPPSDYSIVRSGRPIYPFFGCAGDFGTTHSWGRRWLAWLTKECAAGRMPHIVEVIGSLDGGQPWYWAKWHDWKPKLYTGKGHVTWAHVSCDRAEAEATVDLFAGWPEGPKVAAPAPLRMGSKGAAVKLLQHQLRIKVDGIFGKQTLRAVKAFQQSHKLAADGIVGPLTRAKLGPGV